MTVLMIHEMNEYTQIPSGLCTFDDGLLSQYVYGKGLPNDKIYFISSNVILNGRQAQEFISAPDAHKKYRGGNTENYMTINQIKELINMGIEIGGHSHYHKDVSKIPKLIDKVKHIKEDTELMLTWFKTNLDYVPTSFCFPYNEELNGLYAGLLKPYGFTKFYGSKRVDIPA
jgi:peptidoglycan/xylan/chitin deacetylase (PgdA/CDA1 family)